MIVRPNTLEENDMDGSLEKVQMRTDAQMEALERVQRTRQLPDRMEGLRQLAGHVDDQLDLLVHVLTPVLRPQEPAVPEMATVATPPETELAAFLQDMAGRLTRVHDYLAELVQRVDL
jgi:hypothetical protein